MAKKKVKRISEEKLADLKGFEEVMDLVLDEDEKVEAFRKRKNDNERLNASYEIFNFLEDEIVRLTKIDRFYSQKAPNKIKNDQSLILKTEQIKQKNKLKKDIVNELTLENSPLMKNIEDLFSHAFKGNRS